MSGSATLTRNFLGGTSDPDPDDTDSEMSCGYLGH